MATLWYYQDAGQSLGPVSLAQLHELAQSGTLKEDSLVWREGLADWITLGSLQTNDPLPPTPAPPPAPKAFGPGRPRPAPSSPSSPWPLVAAVGGVALILAFSLGWISRGLLGTPDHQATAVRHAPDAQLSSKLQPSPTRQPGTDATPAAAPTLPPTLTPSQSDEPTSNSSQPSEPAATPSPVDTTVPESAKPTAVAGPAAPDPAPPAPTPPPPPPASSQTAATNPDTVTPAKVETLYQDLDIQRNPKFSVLGVDSIQDLRYQLLSELRVRPPESDGKRKVDQTVLDTRLLKADDLSRPIFEKSLATLKGWQFSYTLNSHGEVIDWTSRPPAGASAAPMDLAGAAGVRVTSVMDEDGWKEMAQLSFFVPQLDREGEAPAEPQASSPRAKRRGKNSNAPDATWSRQMTHEFKPLGSWYGETVFTPKQTRDGVLQIDYAHRLTYKPPAAGATLGGALVIKEAKFASDAAGGTIYYDLQHGRVVSAQEQFRVRGQLMAELAGQSVPVGVEEQQAIAVKISEQKPEWK